MCHYETNFQTVGWGRIQGGGRSVFCIHILVSPRINTKNYALGSDFGTEPPPLYYVCTRFRFRFAAACDAFVIEVLYYA